MATQPKPWRQVARKRLGDEFERLKKELIDDKAGVAAGEQPKGALVKIIAEETQRDGTYSLHPMAYGRIVGAYAVVQFVIAFATLFFFGLSTSISLAEGFSVNASLTIWLLQIAHLVASFKRVDVDDLAGIDFFGRPLYLPRSGLYLIPLFLLTLTTASRNYRDVRFPGPADKIFRVSEELQKTTAGGDMPPAGTDQVRPIFVTTGEPQLTPEEVTQQKGGDWNPLDKQQHVEVAYFVRYRPHESNGGIFRLIRNVGGIRGKTSEETTKIIEELLREQSERDMKSILTQQTYATIIENWAAINEVFALKLQESVLKLGIQIDPRGAGLDDANPSRATNSAQADARRAEFNRQKTITDADAEKQKRTLEGEGTANAERLRLEALAAGYKKIKDDTGVDGAAVVASETAKIALGEKADTIVLGTGGVEQIFGLVKAGQGMLARNKSAELPTTTPTPPPAGGE